MVGNGSLSIIKPEACSRMYIPLACVGFTVHSVFHKMARHGCD